MDRRSSASSHSSSSRTGLVTRLGSALQSWTSGSGSKSWGGSGVAAPREGRPGPLGARYTQQTPESYSPFEPSPHHQLQKRLPLEPAFIAAAAAAATARRVEEPASAVTAAAERGEVQGEAPQEKTNVAGTGPVDRPAEGTTAETLLPADSEGPESSGTQPSAPRQRRAAEGRDAAPIDGNTDRTPSPPSRQRSPSDVRKGGLDGKGGSGVIGSPLSASTAAATGSSDDVNIIGNGDKPLKKAGLWELKAERSRLENTLAEAEADRDVEKARAWEAANRLEAAVARLEGLLQGGGVSVEGAATDSIDRVD